MTDKTKKLEILLIEDNERFMDDAKRFMNERIAVGAPTNVTYATTFDEAMAQMETVQYDGIISDVFIPESKTTLSTEETIRSCRKILPELEKPKSYEGVIEMLNKGKVKPDEPGMGEYMKFKAYEEWTNGKDQAPLGVIIAEHAFVNRIPVVLVTNAYHHGSKASPVNKYIREKNFELVDGYNEEDPYEGLAEQKDFQTGLFALAILHEAKNQGIFEISEKGYTITAHGKELKSKFPDYNMRDWSDPLLENASRGPASAVSIGVEFNWATRTLPENRDEYEQGAYKHLTRDLKGPVAGKIMQSVLDNYFPDKKLE